MQVPNHYKSVQHGFWPSCNRSLSSAAQTTLPSAADRYLESVHFAELALFVRQEPGPKLYRALRNLRIH